jgi:hypothetical protein
MSNCIDVFDDFPRHNFGSQAGASEREEATTADQLGACNYVGSLRDVAKIKSNIKGVRNIKVEIRGRKSVATSSSAAHEPNRRVPTDLSSPSAAKLEAHRYGVEHADEGCGKTLGEIEKIISAQFCGVMDCIAGMLSRQASLIERQRGEQADLSLEILSRIYACELILEMLDKPRYRRARRKVSLGKALARDRRFLITAQGDNHG